MWALINPNDDTVERLFPRPTPFRAGNVLHPAGVFSDKTRLAELNVLPVRRVQVNTPEDTTGWRSSEQLVVELDHVRQEVTWTEDADGPAQRARRDAEVAQKRAVGRLLQIEQATREYMAENGIDFADELSGLERNAIVQAVDAEVPAKPPTPGGGQP